MINAIGEPKVLYYPDLFSAHGAPPGNSFVQCITNPLCDALHEGIFSKASPGRDQIVKPCRSGPIMADRTMKGRKADEGAFLRPLRAITSYLSSSCYSCRSSFLSSSESTSLRRHGPSDDVEPSPPKKPRPDCSDAQKAAYMNNFSNRGTAAEDGPTKAEAANARHSLLPPPASAAATPSDLSSSSSSSSDLPICAAMDPRKTPGAAAEDYRQ